MHICIQIDYLYFILYKNIYDMTNTLKKQPITDCMQFCKYFKQKIILLINFIFFLSYKDQLLQNFQIAYVFFVNIVKHAHHIIGFVFFWQKRNEIYVCEIFFVYYFSIGKTFSQHIKFYTIYINMFSSLLIISLTFLIYFKFTLFKHICKCKVIMLKLFVFFKKINRTR